MQNPETAGRFLLRQNPILREGLLAAPLACFADCLSHAVMLCFVFSMVTAGTVLLSRLIPQRLSASFRIVSYSLTAVLVYVPAAFAAEAVFTETGAGIYLPLLCAGLYLSVGQERIFPRDIPLLPLMKRLLCMIAGVCAAVLLFSTVRGFLGAAYPVFGTPAAGIIMLALCCIITEKICTAREEPPCR